MGFMNGLKKKIFMMKIMISFSTLLPSFLWFNRLIFQSFYKIYNKITGIRTSLTDKKCLVSHTEFEIQ